LPAIDFAQVFIAFIVLLFSLTVHESAHAWTADRLGDPTGRLLGRVSLNPLVHIDWIGTVLFPLMGLFGGGGFFGWAKPVPVNVGRLRRHRTDYMLVAAAGPASNMVIAIVAAAVLALLPRATMAGDAVQVAEPLRRLLWIAMSLNVTLAVLNMLPIPPLDGGTVLGGLLPGALARRYDALRPYGFIILLALMVRGGYAYLVATPARFILSWLQ
jgi:Zn-dependent protease